MQKQFLRFLWIAFFPAALLAGTDDEEPLIIITATGHATPEQQLTATTSVIKREQIEQQQAATVADLLEQVPGLHIAPSGSLGQQTSIYVRGSNSNHLLVLIDGVEINDTTSPSGAFDFATLTTDMIERIEIVRGPQSTRYGSEAIGGVINIITRQTGGNGGSLSLAVGSNHSLRQSLTLRSGNQQHAFLMTLSHFQTDGESASAPAFHFSPIDDDGHRQTQLLLKSNHSLSATTQLNLLAMHTRSKTEFDASADESHLPLTQLTEQLLSATLVTRFNEGNWKSTLQAAHVVGERETIYDFGGFPFATQFHSRRLQIEWRNDFYHFSGHRLSATLRHEQERAVTIFGEPTNFHAITNSIALQDQFELGDHLNGNIGLRYDHHNRFNSHLTWQAGLRYHIPDSPFHLRASVGTGFKSPSLYQLYDSYAGNPDLQPETSRSLEAGIHGVWKDFSAGITLFHNRLNNLIDYDPHQFIYLNQEKAITRGFESWIDWRLSDRLSLRLDYTHTKTADGNGQALLRRPKHQLQMALDYQPTAQWQISLKGLYSGSRHDLIRGSYPQQPITLPAHSKFDLSASYQIAPHIGLTFNVKNLFNRNYQPVHGYQGASRSFHTGVQYQF